jgi:glycosyltransferase involved in cell wall biosynthesis
MHTTIRAGGAQAYAEELNQAVRSSGEFETVFVTRSGPPHSHHVRRAGTRLSVADDDESLYYFYTDLDEFDSVMWAPTDKRIYTEDWRRFLAEIQPDIVHFHHSLLLGYDMIRETRRTLPNAVIVYTLHEFMAICKHSGQMVKTGTYELCTASSARLCHECFPAIPASTFALRKRFIESAFDLVDMFIAPSAAQRDRYVEWGIPSERIMCENYGRFPVEPLPDPPEAGRRRRLGFFGQITPFKGVDILLEAMKLLEKEGVAARLSVWGANMEIQGKPFQDRIARLLDHTAASVRFAGAYEQADLPKLMSSIDWVVVPSIWWETGPLVIHEAMMHRRPVICSDIGSMAERISHEGNGLQFRVRDPVDLAKVIRRAVESPELWDRLRGQIRDPHSMEDHLAVIVALYHDLLIARERLAVA